MATIYYGKDSQGNPIYESSTAGGAVNIPSAINSSTLTPSTTIQPVVPPPVPKTDISSIDTSYTPMAATPQETQASDLTKRIASLNDKISGRTAAQTSAESAAGVDQIQQAINDNLTAVKQLQKESAAAKLQQENRLAPTFAISGQQGAIDRATAVKALTLSSISDALQNNLVAAQHKADRAVEAEFGPLEADLKAKTANLQLILNDPATTLADKNRAQQQQLVLQKQAADIAQQKQDKADIQKMAFEAAQNGKSFTPTAQYPTLSTALTAIASAKTPTDAVQIQQTTGLGSRAKLDTSVVEVNGQKVLIDNQTGQTLKVLGSATSGTQSANQADDIAQAIIDFQTQIQNKGWAGANPDAYAHYKAQLVAKYGASAALELDKTMAALGITVG